MHLTVEEAAGILKVKERTVRAWLKSGKIKGLKIGKEWRVPTEDISTLLDIPDEGIVAMLNNAVGAAETTPALSIVDVNPANIKPAMSAVYGVRNAKNGILKTFATQDLAIKYSEILGDNFDGIIVMSVILHDLPLADDEQASPVGF